MGRGGEESRRRPASGWGRNEKDRQPKGKSSSAREPLALPGGTPAGESPQNTWAGKGSPVTPSPHHAHASPPVRSCSWAITPLLPSIQSPPSLSAFPNIPPQCPALSHGAHRSGRQWRQRGRDRGALPGCGGVSACEHSGDRRGPQSMAPAWPTTGWSPPTSSPLTASQAPLALPPNQGPASGQGPDPGEHSPSSQPGRASTEIENVKGTLLRLLTAKITAPAPISFRTRQLYLRIPLCGVWLFTLVLVDLGVGLTL
jgi:hypothetical protein